MRKTLLYVLDHGSFRNLVGSGERGLADRLMRRQRESPERLGEAELDDLEELLRDIERRGAVRATSDRKTDNLLNRALLLVAEEAGINVESSSAPTDSFEAASHLLGRGGWLSRPLLRGEDLALFQALWEGRVYGSDPPEPWSCDLATAVFTPAEVKTLLSALREVADTRAGKLSAAVQDLLDQHVFPSVEAAARANLGLLSVTRPV